MTSRVLTKLLGVSPVTLYRWRKRGLLKPVSFAGGYLYSLADVLQVLSVRGGLVPIAVLPSRKLRSRVKRDALAPAESFFSSLPPGWGPLRGR
ncbi:MAG: helix-turn-helix domain-containing protein, partial [Thermofilaceae archaeon]